MGGKALSDAAAKFSAGKRLGDDGRLTQTSCDGIGERLAGRDVEHGDIDSSTRETPGELDAGDGPAAHGGDNEIDRLKVLSREIEGFEGAAGFDHLMALGPETSGNQAE